MLRPSQSVNDSAQTVLDVLQEKHPDPSLSGTDAFMARDTLPPLIYVDITVGHVEKVARHIQGGAGPGGSDASQWQNYLLRYGAHSAKIT